MALRDIWWIIDPFPITNNKIQFNYCSINNRSYLWKKYEIFKESLFQNCFIIYAACSGIVLLFTPFVPDGIVLFVQSQFNQRNSFPSNILARLYLYLCVCVCVCICVCVCVHRKINSESCYHLTVVHSCWYVFIL